MENLIQSLNAALEKINDSVAATETIKNELASKTEKIAEQEVTIANLRHMCSIFYEHPLSKEEKKTLALMFNGVKTVEASDTIYNGIIEKLAGNRLK